MEALGRVDFLPGTSELPKVSVTVCKVKLHHLLSPTLRPHRVSLSPYWVHQSSQPSRFRRRGHRSSFSMGGWQGHLEDQVDGTGDIAVVIFGKYSPLCPNPLLPSMTYKAALVCKLHGGTDLVSLPDHYLLCPAQCIALPFIWGANE